LLLRRKRRQGFGRFPEIFEQNIVKLQPDPPMKEETGVRLDAAIGPWTARKFDCWRRSVHAAWASLSMRAALSASELNRVLS
jgi:hypothetical protein